MDIEILKKRIGVLEKEHLSIESEITDASEKITRVINQHNERNNFLTAEKNKLAGKIDILKELADLEKPVVPKKSKK